VTRAARDVPSQASGAVTSLEQKLTSRCFRRVGHGLWPPGGDVPPGQARKGVGTARRLWRRPPLNRHGFDAAPV
jgi:hypothetical protein